MNPVAILESFRPKDPAPGSALSAALGRTSLSMARTSGLTNAIKVGGVPIAPAPVPPSMPAPMRGDVPARSINAARAPAASSGPSKVLLFGGIGLVAVAAVAVVVLKSKKRG